MHPSVRRAGYSEEEVEREAARLRCGALVMKTFRNWLTVSVTYNDRVCGADPFIIYLPIPLCRQGRAGGAQRRHGGQRLLPTPRGPLCTSWIDSIRPRKRCGICPINGTGCLLTAVPIVVFASLLYFHSQSEVRRRVRVDGEEVGKERVAALVCYGLGSVQR